MRPPAPYARPFASVLARAESLVVLVANEFEGGAVEPGDREAVTLREVDLDHLHSVPFEFSHHGRGAGVHHDLAG